MPKPILCLDFDGVIHSYGSGWKGADVIPDPPVAGALQFIVDASKDFTVAIFSSRSNQPNGILAMGAWLAWWSDDPVLGVDMPDEAWNEIQKAIQWPTEKPAAFLTIDDRALTFNGTWPSIEALKAFQPWNKREIGPTGTFPRGKLNDADEGGLNIAIITDLTEGILRIEFGTPIAWIGLTLDQARDLAKLLIMRAGGNQ